MSEIRHKAISSEKIITPIGRIRGCNLEVCVEDALGNDKHVYNGITQETYSVEILLPKDDRNVQAFVTKLKKMEIDVMTKAFGKPIRLLHPPLKDGDESEKEQHKGHWILTPKHKAAVGKTLPIIIQNSRGEIEDKGIIYSGCYARLQILLKSYVHKGSKGISAKLLTIQFAKDGDAIFAGGIKGDQLEAIEEYDNESDEDMLLEEAA